MTIAIAGALITDLKQVSGNSVTTVFTAAQRTTITNLWITPTSGTPNLSISRYDGTTRIYLRKVVAMTAGTPFIVNDPFVLGAKDVLEVTSSSASGDMDVMTTYLSPVAAAQTRGSGS